MTTWISVSRRIFSFTKGSPRYFSFLAPGQSRFLRGLRLPLTHESERLPEEIHAYAASLLDPRGLGSRHVFTGGTVAMAGNFRRSAAPRDGQSRRHLSRAPHPE